MKNNNDNLKEKTINANELKNVSGGSGDTSTKYQIVNGVHDYCPVLCGDEKGPCCYNICPTRDSAFNCEADKGMTIYYSITESCTGCGLCVPVCSYGLIEKKA